MKSKDLTPKLYADTARWQDEAIRLNNKNKNKLTFFRDLDEEQGLDSEAVCGYCQVARRSYSPQYIKQEPQNLK